MALGDLVQLRLQGEPEIHHMSDADLLSAVRPGVYLVNLGCNLQRSFAVGSIVLP